MRIPLSVRFSLSSGSKKSDFVSVPAMSFASNCPNGVFAGFVVRTYHRGMPAALLLRTIAFASAPGLLRVLAVIPVLGLTIYAIASVWMLLAMIVAVRQALDYGSTGRAVVVCAVGWALSLVVAAVIGNIFAPTVF